jgi:hypothetical protein
MNTQLGRRAVTLHLYEYDDGDGDGDPAAG